MPDLITYLKQTISESNVQLRKQIEKNREALLKLQQFGLDKARYTIILKSNWANEGGKSTVTKYTGSLECAIRKAEEEFKHINRRSDVQADWLVKVQLGKTKYPVPEEYWKQYREKNLTFVL